jgi:hypothetical protein
MKQPPSLLNALLDATWKWCRVALDQGRPIPADASAPIKAARRRLIDGASPEEAAVVAGQTDIGLEIWELAVDLHHGYCPPKYCFKETSNDAAPGENRAA